MLADLVRPCRPRPAAQVLLMPEELRMEEVAERVSLGKCTEWSGGMNATIWRYANHSQPGPAKRGRCRSKLGGSQSPYSTRMFGGAWRPGGPRSRGYAGAVGRRGACRPTVAPLRLELPPGSSILSLIQRRSRIAARMPLASGLPTASATTPSIRSEVPCGPAAPTGGLGVLARPSVTPHQGPPAAPSSRCPIPPQQDPKISCDLPRSTRPYGATGSSVVASRCS